MDHEVVTVWRRDSLAKLTIFWLRQCWWLNARRLTGKFHWSLRSLFLQFMRVVNSRGMVLSESADFIVDWRNVVSRGILLQEVVENCGLRRQIISSSLGGCFWKLDPPCNGRLDRLTNLESNYLHCILLGDIRSIVYGLELLTIYKYQDDVFSIEQSTPYVDSSALANLAELAV